MDTKREILDTFVRTRDKTIELVETIPDDWLSRTAEGEEHSLGCLLQHIAGANARWMYRIKNETGEIITPADGVPKSEIIGMMKKTCEETIAFFSKEGMIEKTFHFTLQGGKKCQLTGLWCLLYLMQHEVHHRGKVVLALRQWGAKNIPFMPYKGWE